MIYLDYNATTPVAAAVLEAMLPYFATNFGNAASDAHAWGWKAAEAVKRARQLLADSINSSPQELYFTSGATESINLALKGAAAQFTGQAKHLITVQTEHKAVLDSCTYLEAQGLEVTYLGVNCEGLIELEELKKAMRPDTFLVSVMLANNETGVIQPIREIADIVHQQGAWLMCDAVQAFGKIELDVEGLGIDLMPLSAHKIYGPKGVGALYLRRRNPRVSVQALIHGGGHEKGLRSGTLNVPGIVGFGAAAAWTSTQLHEKMAEISRLRNEFEQALLSLSPKIHLNGSAQQRLPNVSNLRFDGHQAEKLILSLPRLGVSVGSACTSALKSPSHVLTAMGLSEQQAYSSIRFSLGYMTTEAEIREATQMLKNLLSTS